MKIKKLLHSCLLIEENDKNILIDPGSWSFSAKGIKVSDVPKLDAIFITHSHGDHCSPEIIKEFIARDSVPVYCNSDIANVLADKGVTTASIAIPHTVEVAGFIVTSAEAPHGRLPWSTAINNGFWINKRVFLPGDSHEFTLDTAPEVLVLPIAAPWGTATRAIELALSLKPKHVIPCHDFVIDEDFREMMLTNVGKSLTPSGIEYHPLTPTDTLEI